MRDEGGRLIGRPFIDAIWQGKRVRAVGSHLVLRPSTETLHEFFVFVLADTLGKEWWDDQRQRSVDGRHVITRWVGAFEQMRQGDTASSDKREEREGIYSAVATGELLALVCLAYDVYTLRHQMVISPGDSVLKRLAHRDQFQGARYELAVAAVFARAGYGLTWMTATDTPLPEFIAREEATNVEIAVEAKSRHRPGALGRSGAPPEIADLKADVGRLLKDALQKEVDGRPFVICIDLNLPNTGHRSFEEWVLELHSEALNRLGEPSPLKPDPFSAVCFTNYSWHWEGRRPAGRADNFVVVPRYADRPLPQQQIHVLAEALFQYGSLPKGD